MDLAHDLLGFLGQSHQKRPESRGSQVHDSKVGKQTLVEQVLGLVTGQQLDPGALLQACGPSIPWQKTAPKRDKRSLPFEDPMKLAADPLKLMGGLLDLPPEPLTLLDALGAPDPMSIQHEVAIDDEMAPKHEEAPGELVQAPTQELKKPTDTTTKKKKHKKKKKPSFWDIAKNVGITAGACLGEATIDYYMFNIARQKDQQTGDGTGTKWADAWHHVQAGLLIPGTAAALGRFVGVGSAAGFLGAQLFATNDMLYYWLSTWVPGSGQKFKRKDGSEGAWDSGYPANDNITWMNWSPAAWGPKIFGIGDVHHNDKGEQTITNDAFRKQAAIGGGLALTLPILGQVLGVDDDFDDLMAGLPLIGSLWK